MDDTQIIDLFYERSEKAITELTVKYKDICMKTALHILGNHEDAEECVNDAFLNVWNSIPPQRPISLPAYLLRLTKNKALNRYEYLQAEKRAGNYQECVDDFEWCLSKEESLEDAYIMSEISGYIDEYVRSLNKENRYLFIRRYWYMDSYSDLSSATGLKEGAIRTRLSRLREQLKRFLVKRGVDI